jgi:CheY-like chemotaxis protein
VQQADIMDKASIMIVEDDPINLAMITKILTEAKFDCHGVADGQKCLTDVLLVKPTLILMDIRMPVLDGIETCRRLKLDSATRNIPVIFVTGDTDDDTLEEAFGAGAFDYVRKPISRVELMARVRSCLAQQAAIHNLAEEEKLKGVLETAGGICHELNQPLQYVLGAIQILMMDLDPKDAIYQSLDAIRASVEKMGEITRKLTAITYYRSRKYAGGLDILDIQQCINDPEPEN